MRSPAGANAVDLLAGVRPRIGDDPHVWLDPGRYASLARRVAAALGDPAAADALVARLERLDREFRDGLDAVPAARDRHEPRGVRVPRGRRTASSRSRSPASARRRSRARGDLEALVERIRRERATTVFFETLVSPKLAETVAREAGAGPRCSTRWRACRRRTRARGDDYFARDAPEPRSAARARSAAARCRPPRTPRPRPGRRRGS